MTANDAPPGYRIEAGDTDDADALAALWVELADGQRRHGSHLRAAPNHDRIRDAMLQHAVTDTVLVARKQVTNEGASGDEETAGDVVGFITFGRESERYTQDLARGIVHNIYVREGDRGVGVGAALLSAAERALGERGVDAIALQAMTANEAARQFYRRNGYEAHRVELEKPLESDSLTTDDE